MHWLKRLKLAVSRRIRRTSTQPKSKLDRPANAPRIVCVSHDAGFYGAQLLLLHINQVLKTQLGFHVTTVLLGGGDLRGQFAETGDIVDFSDPSWREKATPEVIEVRRQAIGRLYQAGARQVICNTSVSGQVVRLFKEAGFTVVVLIHELPKLIRDFNLEEPVREIGRLADRVVFPAAFVRDRFLPIADLDPARTTIRPQGLYRPNPYRERKDEVRTRLLAEFGFPADARIVVAAGNGDRRKGVDIFCQVAVQVLRDCPNARFIWIGDDNTDIAREGKAVLQAAGQAEHVRFTGVVQEPDRYLQLIAGSGLYLMTSREDPFPSVVLDAMDAALPTVGFSDAGGFSELLEAGAGVLVPFENQRAMAQAVTALLLDAGQARSLGQIGKEVIDRRFYFPDYVYDLLRLAGQPRHKVSVVIPNYNYAQYLPGRLASILAQTYRPYEIVFLDDNSHDDSLTVAENLLRDGGLPYRIIANRENKGCYSQWLSGISLARGDLIWIAEADDLCEPTFLEEVLRGFDTPEVVLAYAQSRKIDGDGKMLQPDYHDYTDDLSTTKWRQPYTRPGHDEIVDTLAVKNTIPNASGVVMRKIDFSPIAAQLLGLKNAGDWFVYLHLLTQGAIHFTPAVLNSHRVHRGGVTRGGNMVRLMSEILQMQEYVRAHYSLSADTLDKVEKMRQFTYEYLGLNTAGQENYRDHPDLQTILYPLMINGVQGANAQ